MRQQDRAHQDMHKWIEENGFSKQWKKHKAQELEKLKAKTKGRRAGAFRHLKRLFFSENQTTRITQVEEGAPTKSREEKERRDKKKARRAGKINAMAAPPEVLMAAQDETIDRDVLDGGDATTAPSPTASSVPPTAARTPVPVPAQAAAGAARTTASTHAWRYFCKRRSTQAAAVSGGGAKTSISITAPSSSINHLHSINRAQSN